MFVVKIRDRATGSWQIVTPGVIIDEIHWKRGDISRLLFATIVEARELFRHMVVNRKEDFSAIKIARMSSKVPHLEYEVLEYRENGR